MANSSLNPLHWLDTELTSLDERGLRRRLYAHEAAQGPTIQVAGQELINSGANDYLGLAADQRLCASVKAAVDEYGWGAGASPLVTGRTALHARLEARLAEFEGTEAAILFPTGFAANVGAVAALVDDGDVVFSDQKNHASLIDGCRLSRAEVRVYPHCDARHLETLLQGASHFRRRLIVTDSLFSMDGDLAPLPALAELAEKYDAMLLVDEAHATGVFGERGRGVSEALHIEAREPIRVGTLSKALGSAGGFVAGSRALIEWLSNRARPYVFSTASPPALAAAALAALEIIRDEPNRRTELLARAAELRTSLQQQGWQTGNCDSQIIPLYIGEPERTMRLSAALRERGLFVPGIRPPSVPAGESLLRISLCYGHTPEMVERLLAALGELRDA